MNQWAERRGEEGVFALTKRSAVCKARLTTVGVRARILALQDVQRNAGLLLPPFRSPLVLDTVGMDASTLIAVLGELHSLKSSTGATMTDLRVIALVAQQDVRAQHLCLLCPVVVLIGSDEGLLDWLPIWLRHLAALRPAAAGQRLVQWLDVPPLPRAAPRDGNVLAVLAAVAQAESFAEVSVRCRMSRSVLDRTIREMKRAYSIPGIYKRPAKLYQAMLRALTTPHPNSLHSLGIEKATEIPFVQEWECR